MLYIGCSGFHYKEWKSFFYPDGLPQTKWFQFYCAHYNTLQLNTTFYKFPTEKSLAKWYNTSPDDFMFSVKAPKAITHFKKFNDCERLLEDFYNAAQQGLQQKLGCILFQLPPQLVYSEHLLHKLIESMHKGYKNVIEFRHASWWNEDVYKKLKEHNIIFCGESYPKLFDEIISTNKNIYYRFHGVPVLYKSLYSEEFVAKIYNEIEAIRPGEAWIYFNNTWGTSALTNSKFLQDISNKK